MENKSLVSVFWNEPDEYIRQASQFILDSMNQDQYEHWFVRRNRLLAYFGLGTTIAAAYLVPGVKLITTHFVSKCSVDISGWKSFDASRLKQALIQMEKQKLIEKKAVNGQEVLQISQNGISKLLKYSLTDFKPTRGAWDGKWRIVMYDISATRKREQQIVRKLFKKMGFYQIQKSVYLYPYPCTNEIEYIRSYHKLSGNIQMIVAESIENDALYSHYFGLDN